MRTALALLFFLLLGSQFVSSPAESDSQQTADQKTQSSIKAAEEKHGATLFQTRGCSACHKTESPLLQWDARRLGPELLRIRSKLNSQWLISWIRAPRLIHERTLMPQFGDRELGLQQQEAEAIAAYLLSSSSELQYSQQALAYDHQYHPTADSILKGRQIFETRGCLGCHDLDKKLAPAYRHVALTGVGLKLAPAWLYTWIEDPRQVSKTTIMPRFALKPKEIAALCDYLMSLTKPELNYPLFVLDDDSPAGRKGNIDRAKKSGCIKCHEIQWIDRKTQTSDGKSKLPYAVDQATLLLGPGPATSAEIMQGKKLISKYGCYSCHLIPGFAEVAGKHFGPDLISLANRSADLLRWGDSCMIPPPQRDWLSWTEAKLRDPNVFNSDRFHAVMPDFNLKPAEIKELICFLKTLGKEKGKNACISPSISTETDLIKGEQVINNMGCTGCHSMYDYNRTQFSAFHKEPLVCFGKIAPNLSPEGLRVETEWLADFMRTPYKMRPYLDAEMPKYNYTDSEFRALMGYFKAQSENRALVTPSNVNNAKLSAINQSPSTGKTIIEQQACTACHKVAAKETAAKSSVQWYKDISKARRFAPDFMFAQKRLKDWWLNKFLENPHALMPDTTMPYTSLSRAEVSAIRSYLIRINQTSRNPQARN